MEVRGAILPSLPLVLNNLRLAGGQDSVQNDSISTIKPYSPG